MNVDEMRATSNRLIAVVKSIKGELNKPDLQRKFLVLQKWII